MPPSTVISQVEFDKRILVANPGKYGYLSFWMARCRLCTPTGPFFVAWPIFPWLSKANDTTLVWEDATRYVARCRPGMKLHRGRVKRCQLLWMTTFTLRKCLMIIWNTRAFLPRGVGISELMGMKFTRRRASQSVGQRCGHLSIGPEDPLSPMRPYQINLDGVVNGGTA